jgi:hypothetical protein
MSESENENYEVIEFDEELESDDDWSDDDLSELWELTEDDEADGEDIK